MFEILAYPAIDKPCRCCATAFGFAKKFSPSALAQLDYAGFRSYENRFNVILELVKILRCIVRIPELGFIVLAAEFC